MCGIFGFLTRRAPCPAPLFQKAVDDLFGFSESRGKEAAGIAVIHPDEVEVLKRPLRARRLIRDPLYRRLFQNIQPGPWLAAIGHSRLVTDGMREVHHNNQPVIKEGLIAVHNGIIANTEDLWRAAQTVPKEYDVDTEALLALLKHELNRGRSLQDALQYTYQMIEGNASLALLWERLDRLTLATNDGSLYYCLSKGRDAFVFASERRIVASFIQRRYLRGHFPGAVIQHLLPGRACFLDWRDFRLTELTLGPGTPVHDEADYRARPLVIRDIEPPRKGPAKAMVVARDVPSDIRDHFRSCEDRIRRLRRCSRCVLPETVPFAQFDENGVCFYCRTHKKFTVRGPQALVETMDRYRKKSGAPDCIVSLSGGRDSCYCLHYVKKTLKMNPVAMTYDWGMVTDLARRNNARLCGKLGVEHIMVSADIVKKRRFIRDNVSAWLRKPELGMVPLFMAGDKHYFYYANRLKKQIGVDLLIMGENAYERSKFKTGFCGILETSSLSYTIPFSEVFRLASYYARQFWRNPAYFNASLADNLWAFAAFYGESHDYLNLYQFIPWEERDIIKTLREAYRWELAPDTSSTWRIGDGTAAFYNYIYYVMAGLTENDTFRSHEVREGLRSRAEALELVLQDNGPRWPSIQWYCETVGIDWVDSLRAINAAPKRYHEIKRRS